RHVGTTVPHVNGTGGLTERRWRAGHVLSPSRCSGVVCHCWIGNETRDLRCSAPPVGRAANSWPLGVRHKVRRSRRSGRACELVVTRSGISGNLVLANLTRFAVSQGRTRS